MCYNLDTFKRFGLGTKLTFVFLCQRVLEAKGLHSIFGMIIIINKLYGLFPLAVLAQPVERVAFNHVVVGSIPTDGAFELHLLIVRIFLDSFMII